MKLKPNSAVWSPSCPFHCNFYRGGDRNSQVMQVPMNSGYTLERAMKMFTVGMKDDVYKWVWLDNVLWPQNTACAFFGLDDNDDPALVNPLHSKNRCW